MDRMAQAFDMMLGAFDITLINREWFFENYDSLRTLMSYGSASIDLVEPNVRIALEHITSISYQLRAPAFSLGNKKGQDGPLASEVPVYINAIAQLRYCFAEDARGLIKGYCLSIVTVAGRGFVKAMRALEPMALFIIMYFGVLLDREARDPAAWWIASAGKDLVMESSEMLQRSSVSQVTNAYEAISWAREQVELPVLVGIVL
jgi:hypothetical protein